MSLISDYIDILLNAEYGEEVRQAIVDAINQCYLDAVAGITPVITTETVTGGHNIIITIGDVVQTVFVADGVSPTAQMDAFIANHAGTLGKTVLWSDDDVSGETSSASGNTVTLSEAVSGYDYIDVYVLGKIVTVTPEYFAEYGISSDDITINSEGVSSSYISVDNWKIVPLDSSDPDGIHYIYSPPFDWSWTGAAGADATGTTAIASLGYPIDKIVGRKLVEDSELVDLRVGVDGTTYQTAGAAVRAQINDLITQIGAGLTTEQVNTLTGLLD